MSVKRRVTVPVGSSATRWSFPRDRPSATPAEGQGDAGSFGSLGAGARALREDAAARPVRALVAQPPHAAVRAADASPRLSELETYDLRDAAPVDRPRHRLGAGTRAGGRARRLQAIDRP